MPFTLRLKVDFEGANFYLFLIYDFLQSFFVLPCGTLSILFLVIAPEHLSCPLFIKQ
jgi:hypothetical protein